MEVERWPPPASAQHLCWAGSDWNTCTAPGRRKVSVEERRRLAVVARGLAAAFLSLSLSLSLM